jgi:hypothetical protein
MGWSVGLRPHKKGTKMMMSTKITTKTEHLFKALVILAMLASLLAVLAVRPAHATPTFAVNFTGDLPDRNVGDGLCDVTTSTEDTCTLRAAIQEANATSGADTIGFNILSTASDCNATAKVCTITPASVLPPVTERVTIDGYTQPGASPNTKAVGNDAALKIQLNGTSVGGVGLKIQDASNSVIKGLVVNRFAEGITVGGDSGANNLQNKPVLSSAKTASIKTTVAGKLVSTPNQAYTIEFYSSPKDTNEGKKFIGEKGITTSVDGLRSFTFTPATSVTVGQAITVTATRNSTHDTSEFSAPRKVVAP